MEYTELPEKSFSRAMKITDGVFPPVAHVPYAITSIPKTTIYVYNVGSMEHTIKLPPNHPHVLIPACPNDQPYILACTVSDPFIQVEIDTNTGEKNWVPRDGYREATVMLSPNNPGVDQNWRDNSGLQLDQNLNDFGVFWSKNSPPSEQELKAARLRLERTLREALDFIDKEEAQNPEHFRDRVNRIHHAAAVYYNEPKAWHRDTARKESAPKAIKSCPYCGEDINISAIKCKHCGEFLEERPRTEPKESKRVPKTTTEN